MDLPMKFEMCMQEIFGDKAYQIAGTYNPEERSKWIKFSLDLLSKNIDRLDIAETRKAVVDAKINRLLKEIPRCKDFHSAPWEMVFNILSLCFSAFDVTRRMDDVSMNWQETAIATRKRLVDQLKEEGCTDMQVARALNISSYQVKLIKKEKPQGHEES